MRRTVTACTAPIATSATVSASSGVRADGATVRPTAASEATATGTTSGNAIAK